MELRLKTRHFYLGAKITETSQQRRELEGIPSILPVVWSV